MELKNKKIKSKQSSSNPVHFASSKKVIIINAASEVFLNYGFNNASMDLIAKRANVSKQTIYSHFGNKEQLFLQTIIIKCEEYFRPISGNLNNHSEPISVLKSIGYNFLTMITSQAALKLYRVVISECLINPNIGRIFYKAGPEKMLDIIEPILKKMKQEKKMNINDTKLAAEEFLSLLEGTLHRRVLLNLIKPSKELIQSHLKNSVQAFLNAYK